MWDLLCPNRDQSRLRFTLLAMLFVQGSSRLLKRITNLTFVLFDLPAMQFMSFLNE